MIKKVKHNLVLFFKRYDKKNVLTFSHLLYTLQDTVSTMRNPNPRLCTYFNMITSINALVVLHTSIRMHLNRVVTCIIILLLFFALIYLLLTSVLLTPSHTDSDCIQCVVQYYKNTTNITSQSLQM